MHIGADDFVRGLGGAGDAALDLRVVDAVGQNGKRLRRLVAGLHLHRRPIDAAAIEPRRGPGFQSAERKTQTFKRQRKPERRRLPDPARRGLLFPAMDKAAQKSAGRENDGAGRKIPPVSELDPGNAALRNHDVIHLTFDYGEIFGFANGALYRVRIQFPVRLCARAAHCRTFTAVQHPELNAAQIRGAAHQAIQGIDFADQMSLAQAADRRIAGHGAHGRELVGDKGRVGAHARRGSCCLGPGVPAAHDNHVKTVVHRELPFAALSIT